MTEFIDDLFSIHSNYGTPNLKLFAELVNRETFWVVTEVTKECNINRRAQILKRFIKVIYKCSLYTINNKIIVIRSNNLKILTASFQNMTFFSNFSNFFAHV